jgi:REP element-mobilizing transposase RayT
MPQSFVQLYGHLIFSTKNRSRWLDESIRPRTHAYIATILRDFGCKRVTAGGVDDHVHISFDLPKGVPLSELVRKVKTESTRFVRRLDAQYKDFTWQGGYALFSVSPIHIKDVEQYVRNQESHHHRLSFEDELRSFLDRYAVDYDERYLLD